MPLSLFALLVTKQEGGHADTPDIPSYQSR